MNTNKKNGETATKELLAEIYRNVTMGSENLSTVVPMIKDGALLSNVTAQIEKYAEFTNRTGEQLKKHSEKPKEPTIMKKAMSRGGIAINTIFDSSDSHIAEMIERGTRTGVDQLERTMTDLRRRGCDDASIGLCSEVITFERREADRIKDYM